MRIFCVGLGCTNFVEVSEPVAAKCSYICRECAPKDVTNEDLRFQEVQFDPKVNRRGYSPDSANYDEDAHRLADSE